MEEYKIFLLQDYTVEIGLLLLFAAVIVYHYRGKQENRRIVQEYYSKLGNLKHEFAQMGDGFGHQVIYNSPNEYFLYGTGRVYVDKMMGIVKLAPRHDLTRITSKEGDKIRLEFTLSSQNSHIFALFLKRNAANKLKRWDLDKLTGILSFSGLRKDVYTVVGDNLQVFSSLLSNQEIKQSLNQFAGLSAVGEGVPGNYLLEEIICSDSCSSKPTSLDDLKRDLELSFTFRLSNDQEEIDKMISFVFAVVDAVSSIVLSKDVVDKISRDRRMAEEAMMKASKEDIQASLSRRKLLEKKKREEARSKLSPEEARKAEEKEKKKELKKSKSKMMKKGKVLMR